MKNSPTPHIKKYPSAGDVQESATGAEGQLAKERGEFVRHILESKAESSSLVRRAAASCEGLPLNLVNLVEKIHKHPYQVMDEDIDAIRAEYSEDEIFEIVLSASIGASHLRLMAGLKAVREVK